MPEFQIKLMETQEGYITIKAENKKQAEKEALNLIYSNGFDLLDREIFRKIIKRKASIIE